MTRRQVKDRTRNRAGKQSRSSRSKARKHSPQDAGQRSKVTLAVSLVVLAVVLGLSYMAIARYVVVQNRLTNPAWLFGGGEASPAPEGEIASNIRYKSLVLGGKTYEAARESLENSEESLLASLGKLKLYYTDKEFVEKTPYDLGLRLDIDHLLRDAEAESKKLVNRNYILEDRFRLDSEASREAIEALAEELNQEGGDAKAIDFDFETYTFEFEDEKEGRELVKSTSGELIKKALKDRDFNGEIKLDFERVAPGRTAEELSARLGFVASATTPIDYYSEGRNQNVASAAEHINGTILNPGESFSFKEALGPITEENGFALAGIQDENGNNSMGMGGGICQPSTTIYQAAVRANLRIDVHNFHTTPVNYCPIGTDAMVSDWSDMVFTNTTDYPFAIAGRFDGTYLTFDFYGPTDPEGGSYDLFVEDLGAMPVEGEPKKIQDDKLEPDETEVRVNPRPNRHVKVYKVYYDADGNLVSKELMFDHIYPGYVGEVAVNEKTSSTSPSTGSTEAPVVAYYVLGDDGVEIPVYETKSDNTNQLFPPYQTNFQP